MKIGTEWDDFQAGVTKKRAKIESHVRLAETSIHKTSYNPVKEPGLNPPA